MGSTTSPPEPQTQPDTRAVFFFDIDNCLYSRNANVHGAMVVLINKYFTTHLSISSADATRLHQQYFKDYGLAIEGLSRFHKISPMDFNREVDDALPLDDLLHPDASLRAMLLRLDRSKVRPWLFTNAHVTHGQRVVKLLGIEDCFEGITFCDYRESPIVPKPKEEMFRKAEREAGVVEGVSAGVYYVDDSGLNCTAAFKRGWVNTVHLVEEGVPEPDVKACKYQIERLDQLETLFPELFTREKEEENQGISEQNARRTS